MINCKVKANISPCSICNPTIFYDGNILCKIGKDTNSSLHYPLFYFHFHWESSTSQNFPEFNLIDGNIYLEFVHKQPHKKTQRGLNRPIFPAQPLCCTGRLSVALLASTSQPMWLTQQMERCHANRQESLGGRAAPPSYLLLAMHNAPDAAANG